MKGSSRQNGAAVDRQVLGALAPVNGGLYALLSSPSGRSTLITSAPRSPRVVVQNGLASSREKSATTSRAERRLFTTAPPREGGDLSGRFVLVCTRRRGLAVPPPRRAHRAARAS